MLDFRWHAVDVDGDEELRRRYADRVPVVACGEEEIMAAPFRQPALRVAIARALSARSGG